MYCWTVQAQTPHPAGPAAANDEVSSFTWNPHWASQSAPGITGRTGVRPGVALERQHPADLLWIRDEFLRHRGTSLPGKVVVHGHTICDMPQDLGHRVNIDTGAFVSGRLTCLVLRGVRRQFMSTLDG